MDPNSLLQKLAAISYYYVANFSANGSKHALKLVYTSVAIFVSSLFFSSFVCIVELARFENSWVVVHLYLYTHAVHIMNNMVNCCG